MKLDGIFDRMMTMFETESQSYYEILDVKPDASQNDIRQAYFRAKSAYGKDSAALYSILDEQQTRQVLDSIEQAYLVLSNPEKRKEYDKVHGFLKSDEFGPPTKKGAQQPSVFSFGRGLDETADAAHQAAATVFGAGTMDDMSNMNPSGSKSFDPPASRPGGANSAQRPPVPRDEDYRTPRTLASHNAAGPPAQEYTVNSFNSNENRLGIIRRLDLVKNYEPNPALEEEIAQETTFRGEFLRRVREYKCISVEELSEFTKISKTYINCIEGEEFESLPAPAYLRGFIIQIAKALKLPHDKAATGYMTQYKNTVLK